MLLSANILILTCRMEGPGISHFHMICSFLVASQSFTLYCNYF